MPGGHHGLSREQILESQRERLLAAVAHEVAARGYRATTITEVVKLASVSTRDFYEHFEGKEQCFLAAFEAVRDHLEELLTAATADQPDWPHQVIAALRAALRFFAAEPDLARLCLVEPVSATPTIAIRFREVVLACAPALARGRAELADGHSLPQSTEDSLLGGIVSLATRSILAGETAEAAGAPARPGRIHAQPLPGRRAGRGVGGRGARGLAVRLGDLSSSASATPRVTPWVAAPDPSRQSRKPFLPSENSACTPARNVLRYAVLSPGRAGREYQGVTNR